MCLFKIKRHSAFGLLLSLPSVIFTACLGGEPSSSEIPDDSVIEVVSEAESWGPWEHTHIDYRYDDGYKKTTAYKSYSNRNIIFLLVIIRNIYNG